jgi:hypothetical protein
VAVQADPLQRQAAEIDGAAPVAAREMGMGHEADGAALGMPVDGHLEIAGVALPLEGVAAAVATGNARRPADAEVDLAAGQ